jgi:hypothetical protein
MGIEYSKGYQAGVRRSAKDIAGLTEEIRAIKKVKSDIREERVFIQCLELVMKNCGHWTVGEKPLNNAEQYCKLAKIFTDNSISVLEH